jgi:RecG-like helicase
VVKTSLRRFGGWKKIFEATLQESDPNALSEPLVVPVVQSALRAENDRYRSTHGGLWQAAATRKSEFAWTIQEFEVIENDEEISIHFRRITPIYPATEGLSQRVLRSMIYRLLNELPSTDAGLER